MKKNFFIFCFFIFTSSFSQSLSEKKCDVFPISTIALQEVKPLNFTENYSSSGSSWSLTFGESEVYESLLKYEHPSNPDCSYELRIGKGGQIYSFKTSSGETVPPQWRNPTGGNPDRAPWVDDVWQIVAVDGNLNDPENDNKYFIHQAGVYLLDDENLSGTFYSPQVASYYNEAEQEYTTVNWGQQAHIADNIDVGFTSALLYYAKYKNLGDGIIQVDYIIYNFGNDTITHTNLPWGGVRRSTYDNFFVSNTNNSYNHVEGLFSANTSFPFNETNGWMAFSSNATGTTPSLGLILNNDQGILRTGDAGGTVANRNYTVYSGIKNGFTLDFGKIFRVRNYFILDSSVPNIQAKIANLNLQANTYANFDNKTESEVEGTTFFFSQNGNEINVEETTNTNGLNLKLQPYNIGYPLFLIEGLNDDDEQEYRITSDLYTFSDLPYDGRLQNIELLGFSNTKKSIMLETITICFGSDYKFPDGTIQTNIVSDMKYISDLGITDDYNNLIQTSIIVDKSLNCNLSTEDNEKLKIEAFPNPVDAILKLSENVNKARVYSALGKRIISYGIGDEFNVSNLSKGFYFLYTEQETGETAVTSFIKK